LETVNYYSLGEGNDYVEDLEEIFLKKRKIFENFEESENVSVIDDIIIVKVE